MTLDLERLRASLLAEPLSGHFVQEDGVDDQPLTPAAVLFPIVLRDGGQTVLLTQRTAHLRDHAGQISFPGGRVEAEDLSPSHTALRETEEEIGLPRERIEILGFLPEYRTGTGFRVTPVVALVQPPFDLRPRSSKYRSPSCSIRLITNSIRCIIAVRCVITLPCLTATISSGAPLPA